MAPPESEVLARLARWAEADAPVRALVLTSSRVSPTANVDGLSDYDMVVGVEDSAAFTGDPAWLIEAGGPILVRLDPEPGATYVPGQFNRLVIHEDGTKIDWNVWPADALRAALHAPALRANFDVGYRVLLDKDGLSTDATAPTYTAHIPPRPTEAEYLALVEEFWWDTSYVAKDLWRDELIQAKYMLDRTLKIEHLRRMLEWRIEIDHNWSLRPGLLGRGLKSNLDAATWAELEGTFVGPELDANWRALWATAALFRRVAREVGDALGYQYPDALDRGVMRYLQDIHDLPR